MNIEDQKKLLHELVEKKQLPQALLFSGSAYGTQEPLMVDTVQSLLCLQQCGQCIQCIYLNQGTHPDICVVRPNEKNRIGIDEIHNAIEHMTIRAQYAPYRLVLIYRMELMSIPGANALLKVIEEPPTDGYFFMSTNHLYRIPETIRSRTTIVHSHPVTIQEAKHLLASTDESAQSIHRRIETAEGRYQLLHSEATENAPWVEWERDKQFWAQFLDSDIPGREKMIQERFTKTAETEKTMHETARMLEVLEVVYHDRIKRSTSDSPDNNQRGMINEYAAIGQLRAMAADQVNKKMIFDYLITSIV